MCRMLFIHKKEIFSPLAALQSFSDMCEASRTPIDVDRQEDGWGVSWINSSGEWQVSKSTKAIWEDTRAFKDIPTSHTFLMHARSKSFKQDRVDTRYNQPFIHGGLAFTFNGHLSGVRIKIPGEIGSQKVFNILKNYYETYNLIESVEMTKHKVVTATRRLNTFNIIACDTDNVVALCLHDNSAPEYQTMVYRKTPKEITIASEPVSLYPSDKWERIRNRNTINFKLTLGDKEN